MTDLGAHTGPAASPGLPRRAAVAGVAGVAMHVLLLAGCAAPGGTPDPARPGAVPRTGPAVPDVAAALETERRWLQSWFKDTPVVIEMRGGALAVEVPLTFSFDTGRTLVKPPLAAVLDKVAQSLRRQTQLRLALLAAPGDARSDTVATGRAAQVRRHLRGRGVPDGRMAAPTASESDRVQLRLVGDDSPPG